MHFTVNAPTLRGERSVALRVPGCDSPLEEVEPLLQRVELGPQLRYCRVRRRDYGSGGAIIGARPSRRLARALANGPRIRTTIQANPRRAAVSMTCSMAQ